MVFLTLFFFMLFYSVFFLVFVLSVQYIPILIKSNPCSFSFLFSFFIVDIHMIFFQGLYPTCNYSCLSNFVFFMLDWGYVSFLYILFSLDHHSSEFWFHFVLSYFLIISLMTFFGYPLINNMSKIVVYVIISMLYGWYPWN